MSSQTVHSQGLSHELLNRELENVSQESVLQSLNRLLTTNRIVILKNASGTGLIYKEQSAEEALKFNGLTAHERLIHQVIEGAGNMGIWTKDIKKKSNLPQLQITKSLKILEGRKLIKPVKSVAIKNKKVYMLFDLEPHVDVSGDIWYSGQDIDAEFIEVLNKQCYEFIKVKGYSSPEEICAFIRQSGISKVQLKVENIQSILDTLIYDGKVEAVEDPRGPSFLGGKSVLFYKPTQLDILPNGFTSTPCGICPVFNQCTDGGEISPINCIYFGRWLKTNDF